MWVEVRGKVSAGVGVAELAQLMRAEYTETRLARVRVKVN